jgi:hypothetical protein
VRWLSAAGPLKWFRFSSNFIKTYWRMKMSNDDMHPALKYQSQLDGWSQDADVDRDSFVLWQQYKMALHSPETRRQALNEVDRTIAQNEGSLRSQSQLFDLRRKLSGTHERLLKIGR